MNICVVYGGGDVPDISSGLRSRLCALAPYFAKAESSIAFKPVETFRDPLAAEFDTYIFHKCSDARGELLINALSRLGATVGVDIIDDEFVGQEGEPTSSQIWLDAIASSLNFIVTTTQALHDRIVARYKAVPCHIVRHVADVEKIRNRKESIQSRLRFAAITRTLTITWFGHGGLSDVVAFGDILGAIRRRGFKAILNILTDRASMTPQALSALRSLPLDYRVEEWSADREQRRLDQSTFVFLPVNASAFSTARSLNRALVALSHGCQVLSCGYPLYNALGDLVYRDIDRMLSDILAGRPALCGRTFSAFAKRVGEIANPAAEASHLLSFLEQLPRRNVDTRTEPPLIAVLHGQTSTGALHKFAQKLRQLSIATPYFSGSIAGDLRLTVDARSGTLMALVSPTAAARLDPSAQMLLHPASDEAKAPRVLPLDHLADDIQADLIAETRASPQIVTRTTYRHRMAQWNRLLKVLFPNSVIVESEPGLVPELLRVQPMVQPSKPPSTVSDAHTSERQVRTDPGIHVAWLLQKIDFASASARYRSFHMAMALGHYNTRHSFFTDAESLAKSMKSIDVAIVVKRMEPSILSVLASAKDLSKPVFLDLCDDMLSPYYRRQGAALNRMVFAAAVTGLAGIVVPSGKMAEHLRSYIRSNGLPKTPVFVIPDTAETPELLEETRSFFNQLPAKELRAPPFVQSFGRTEVRPKIASRANPMNVVWFGNFGAAHSNFGIPSLLAAVPALRAVNQDIPLELTVISNDETRFRAVVGSLDFPARYVPWNEETIYDHLYQADLALLTNGDDDFSQLKSANRALLALALGIPVIATENAAMCKLQPAVVVSDFEGGLRRFLGPSRRAECQAVLATAQAMLSRYDLAANGRRWRRVLLSTLNAEARRPALAHGPSALIFLEIGYSAELLREAVDSYRQAGIKPLVTLNGAASMKIDIRECLIDLSVLPTILMPDDLKTYDVRWLRGASEVVVESNEGKMSRQIRSLANSIGAKVLTLKAATQPDRDSGMIDARNGTRRARETVELVSMPLTADEVPVVGGPEFAELIGRIEARRSNISAQPDMQVS